VFDAWIGKHVKARFAFERYADDILIHTSSEKAAQFILKLVKERMLNCGLELHPEKTKLVQTESHRREEANKSYPSSFVFLGHQFSKDLVRLKNGSAKLLYVAKVSKDARKRMLRQLKYEKLHKRTCRLEELAAQLNQKVAGWVSYFGKYAGTSMHQIYAHINRRLVKWVMWKYRKFKLQAIAWLKRKWQEQSMLFVHWQQTKFFCIY
jgi:cell division protein FtsB